MDSSVASLGSKSTSNRAGAHDEPFSSQPGQEPIPEADRLTSFVDMVFGGQLASILVCEKCKKVSCTYEDFNDLSLSIKAEDYEKARKRDRLRSLAKRFKVKGLDFAAPEHPRSSSVPASPTRRSLDPEKLFEQTISDERRRSLDLGDGVMGDLPVDETNAGGTTAEDPSGATTANGMTDGNPLVPPREHVSFKDGEKSSKEDKPIEKPEEEDGWVKLSRRISIGMGLTRKARGKDSKHGREMPSRKANDDGRDSTGKKKESSADSTSAAESVKSPQFAPASGRTTPALQEAESNVPPVPAANLPVTKFTFARRPSPSRAPSSSPALSPALSPAQSPALAPSTAMEKHPPSPMPLPVPFVRPRSPRPPKPTREQSEYLRRLLADVPASSGVAPFGLNVNMNVFRSTNATGSAPDFGAGLGLWPKVGNVQSVEECLRMFTAVEVLDGENMVGCHRCWKIAHGEYVPRMRPPSVVDIIDGEEEVSGSSDSEEAESSPAQKGPGVHVLSDARTAASPALTSLSTISPQVSTLDLNEGASLESAPTTMQSHNESVKPGRVLSTASLPRSVPPAPGIIVPSISMTGPESPLPAVLTPVHVSQNGGVSLSDSSNAQHTSTSASADHFGRLSASQSKDSLQLPRSRHARRAAHGGRTFQDLSGESSSPSSDDSSDEQDESETSVQSDSSVGPRDARSVPNAPSTARAGPLTNPRPATSKDKDGVPRSKQVTFRRAYKRYMIAKPPPVLVIHLKRFQQVGKSALQFQSFSNFKKLDDPVSYPEYLDLAPFLLPRKADFGLRKSKKFDAHLVTEKNPEKCMYRLYAVVVHIGNMVCPQLTSVVVALAQTKPSCLARRTLRRVHGSARCLGLSSARRQRASRCRCACVPCSPGCVPNCVVP